MASWGDVDAQVRALIHQGHYGRAHQVLGPFAETLRAVGDVVHAVQATLRESLLLGLLGDRDASLHRAAWAMAQVHDPRHSQRWTDRRAAWAVTAGFGLYASACVEHGEVHLDRADDALTAGLGFVERIGRPGWRAGLLAHRASLRLAQGELEEALALQQEAIALKRSQPRSPGMSLPSLLRDHGFTLNRAGRAREAAEVLRDLLAQPEVPALDRFAAWLYLAHGAVDRDAPMAAVEAVERALELGRDLGDEHHLAALGAGVEAWLLAGDLDRAQAASDQALRLASHREEPGIRVHVHQDAFDVAMARGRRYAAEEHLDAMRRAVRRLHRRGHRQHDDDLAEREARYAGGPTDD